MKLCPSRDSAAPPPAPAWLHRPFSSMLRPSAFLVGPASAPSTLTVAQHLFGASWLRLSCSAPVGLAHWQPCKPCPRQLPPLLRGGSCLVTAHFWGWPHPRASPPAPRGRSPGRQGHHVPLEAVGHSAFSHEQPCCAA